MSVPNKSLDKNKRFSGVRANDFVPKARTNDANRSTIRSQGWANLGKINSRRIPPPANLPSLKSETGTQQPIFDPTNPVSHGWNSMDNQSSNNSYSNATQQEIDSLPVHSSAPTTPAATTADFEKSRTLPTWSNITAGTSTAEPIPSLLGLNDFPRLANNQDRKSSSIDSTSQQTNPTLRPSNIATWKEGGSRIQPLMNDMPPNLMSNNNRHYSSSPMWAYPATRPGSSNHQSQQRSNTMAEYKTPTILRHKDIDNLSKLTDNTWANASQEVNYDERITFSDDEDDRQATNSRPTIDSNNKTRRNHTQLSSHTRLIQDDEHFKQLQEHKNSEFINALTIAKQRRDEQERHLKSKSIDESSLNTANEHQSVGGYSIRPLLTVGEQDHLNSSTWHSNREVPTISRTRHDTPNSQTFSMKSWSDQMDSYNYPSSQEKSSGNNEYDQGLTVHENNQSQSESSSPLPIENDRKNMKNRKGPQPLMQSKVSTRQFQQSNSIDYQENLSSNSNTDGPWKHRNEPKDTQHLTHSYEQQTIRSTMNYVDQSVNNKSNSSNKPSNYSKRNPDRGQNNSRSKLNSSSSQQSNNNRNQTTWQAIPSPNRAVDSIDSSVQETTTNYKSQQRYSMNNTMPIDTSSIPPLMSVRSDVPPTVSTHYSQRHEFYNETSADKSNYYQSTNGRYPNANRGYTALGSYGRYRRGSAHRTPTSTSQQYSNYPVSNSPATTNNSRTKKNSNNQRKSNQPKNSLPDEVIVPLMSQAPLFEPLINKKSGEQVYPSSNSPNETKLYSNEEKTSNSKVDLQSNKNNSDSPPDSLEKETSKTNQKRRAQQDQQNFHQTQQVTRHRINYNRTMPNYESSGMNTTQIYYGSSRRSGNPSQTSHVHDNSTGHYYEANQTQYNQQYTYSNTKKLVNKRGQTSMTGQRQGKTTINNGNYRSKNANFRHHSTSDNDQKEAEEWETASESSTNVRNGHHENSSSSPNVSKSNNNPRPTSKKTFNQQRPHTRQIFKYTNA